ncbi:MAG TPA: hypothetical protein VHA78_01935 [Candidatus Peribacteraceae bacterium]|nr:hypothetical protein [Candidatus Peribacteraceae bacterium]
MQLIIAVWYHEENEEGEDSVTYYTADPISKRHKTEIPKLGERLERRGGKDWHTYVYHHVLDIPEVHEEVLRVLLGLEFAKCIPTDTFIFPWPWKNSRLPIRTPYVFVITKEGSDVRAKIFERDQVPAMDVLLEDDLFIVDDAEPIFETLCHHSALRKDLLSFLEFMLREGYLAYLKYSQTT